MHVVDSAEAARMLGLSHRTGLAYHVRRGIDPVARIGGTDVYSRAEIEEYADCVLLCERGDAARWRGAVMFTADEARRLGMRLMAMADQAEGDVT